MNVADARAVPAIARHRQRLREVVRMRLAFIMLIGLLGGSLAVVASRVLAPNDWTEDALRSPLVAGFTVLPIALYEGWRRQRLLVPRLWVAAAGATALASGVPWLLARLGSAAQAVPAPVLFGVYALAATLGLVAPDFGRRGTIAVYQLVGAFAVRALGWLAVTELVPFGSAADEVTALVGPLLGFSIAGAYALVPLFFEDVHVFVVGAGRPVSAAKFNNKLTGYWSMAGEQRTLTVVDGTTDAYQDPTRVWIPEALVPEVAVFRREGRDLLLELSSENGDPLGRGAVAINGRPLAPGRASLLANGDTVVVGSVSLQIETPGRRRK